MPQSFSAPRIIERPRIRQQLLDALETTHVLLTAPAGYGKSVALYDLLRRQPKTHLISLTPSDLDLVTLEARLMPYLDSGKTIFLDDVHLLTGGVEVCAWLQHQLMRRRPRWIIAGRSIPFATDTLVVSGQAVHFTKTMLAFTLDECQALLTEKSDKVVEWHKRLGGWSLALSLLSRLPEAADRLPTTEAHLFTYLTQAVFAQLSPELIRFMRVTAVPLRFNTQLAAHLWDGETDADTLLAEVQRADLYIQPADKSGWHRYHDLIREYLLREGDDNQAIAKKAVSWFQEHDVVDTAVDQALDSGLSALAAQIVSQIQLSHFHDNGSYLTYRRWVRALDDEAITADLMMLVRLANAIQLMAGYANEAREYNERAIRLATRQGNFKVMFLAQANLAFWHYQEGELETGRQLILPVLTDPNCQGYPRLFALRIASLILSDGGYYHEVRPYFEQAIALAYERETHNEPVMNQANMAAMYWLPLGEIERAEEMLTAVLTHFADSPGWLSQYLSYWCELQVVKGDWAGLAQAFNRFTELLKQIEIVTIFTQSWLAHYQTIQAIVDGDDERVQTSLTEYASLAESKSLHQNCVDWLACWHLRRRREWGTTVQRGRQALTQPTQFAFYRARLALEVDIAQGMQLLAGEIDAFELQADTKRLIEWRSRAELVRLQALLAVVCWHQGHPRWRRHWRAVTRALNKSMYAHLLTRYDPDLGAYFWRIGVAAGLDEPRVESSLIEIGQIDPLLKLLEDEDTAVRSRTTAIIAQIGDERAMPGLTAVLAAEKDKPTQKTIESAILHLENQPPPPLKIQLMGDFALWRGGEHIASKAWHRPIVLRLFQYFAVHAGQPLAKDRILDDLWPDTDPAKAWTTFRTVYSRLRRVMEPFMRSKAPNRYVTVRSETYTFDSDGNADIDAIQFEQVCQQALRVRNEADTFQLSEALLMALKKYTPLLPNLPYADWLLESRQKMQALFIEGSLHVAQVYLVQGNHVEAVAWARQTIDAAPWLEEAYQVLMRGYGRQGQRTLALRVYDEATANLQHELNLPPSAMTEWLADRLRSEQSI